MNAEENHLIEHELLNHLKAGMAFRPVGVFLDEITFDQLGVRPAGLPYSFYEIFYHITFAQRDILDFITAETYDLPDWPKDYWPASPKPESEKDWQNLKESYNSDIQRFETFLNRSEADLLQPVKHASKDEQTLLRESLLMIGHLAYHNGQLVVLLRLLGLHD